MARSELGVAPFTLPGVALMEVVAATAIFFIAAMFVMDGLNSSLKAVRYARIEADAADLAVTVLSEVQMGLLQIKNEGPSPFDETLFPGWTWELAVSGIEDLGDLPDLKHVEVIVRQTEEGFVYRTGQLVWDDPAEQTAGVTSSGLSLPGAGTGAPSGDPPNGAPEAPMRTGGAADSTGRGPTGAATRREESSGFGGDFGTPRRSR